MDFQLLDYIDSAVYLSDPNTYELVYANQYCRKQLGLDLHAGTVQTCYQALQNLDAPCPFCNNAQLAPGKTLEWEHYNLRSHHFYHIQDRLIDCDGRLLRFEIAVDITKREQNAQQTQRRLSIEEKALTCLHHLMTEKDFKGALNDVLESIREHYGAARSYIIEFDAAAKLARNTFERCAPGIAAQQAFLQNIPLKLLHFWLKQFELQKDIYIPDINMLGADRKAEYDILKTQNISSLMAVPFQVGDEITGFLGVDDPVHDGNDPYFMQTLSYFIGIQLKKNQMEEQLRISEEQFRLAIMQSNLLVCQYDLIEHRITFPDILMEKYRYHPADVRIPDDPAALECIAPGSRKEYARIFNELLAGAESVEATVEFLNLTRENSWQHIVYTRINNTYGTARRAIGIYTDVTKKMREDRFNEELRHSLSDLYFGVYRINLEAGTLLPIRVPDDVVHLVGRREQDGDAFLSTLIDHVIHPNEREACKKTFSVASLRQLWQSGKTKLEREYRRMINGEYHWISLIGYISEQTQPFHQAILALRDIHEYKSFELKSHLQEQKLANILRIAYEIVTDIDLSTGRYHLTFFTDDPPFFAPAYGDYEVLLQQIAAACDPRDKDALLDAMSLEKLRTAAAMGEQRDIVFRYRVQQHGTQHWREIKVIAAHSADGVIACAISRDITSELQTQELVETQNRALKDALTLAENANRAKSDFFSKMSHDIRTPLNAIIGMTSIASAHLEEPSRLCDCLDKINISSQHLLHLINDVLDMSKIESGKVVLNEAPFDLSAFSAEISAMVSSSAKSKQLTLYVSTEALSHTQVLGDKLRLQQICLNILSNSVKFTSPGGHITFCIQEEPSSVEGYGRYVFLFADNGIGMSQQFLKKLFQPFEREENSLISKTEGTGLGMSIAHNLVQMMNGYLQVESKPNKGTAFKLTLHLRLHDEACTAFPAPEKSAVLEHPVDFSGKRLLVVEDNELNREIVAELLKPTHAEIQCVENGRQAVDCFADTAPGYFDLILMDIQMPVMNGLDAACAIRALQRPDSGGIPILAMTANAFTEDVANALKAGMNGHISKPIDLPLLLDTLRRFLLP